jgi:hypothetical protein
VQWAKETTEYLGADVERGVAEVQRPRMLQVVEELERLP